MRVIIEYTNDDVAPGLRASVECGYDDVTIGDAIDMVASCLQGLGYLRQTVIDGFNSWLEENDTEET